ncbi:MAG: hypothetical protein NWE89_15230 [Candidatus Bathyarchaeota archaeon]|nr:hypothetical protein [Candidatus Bathyarchaeota archaeon]
MFLRAFILILNLVKSTSLNVHIVRYFIYCEMVAKKRLMEKVLQ